MNVAGEWMPAGMVRRFPMSALPVRVLRAPVVSRPGARPRAFALVWAMLALQVVWMLGWTPSAVHPGDKAGYDGAVVVLCAALALTAGRVRWLNAGVRLGLGLGLLFSVADRFGLLGGPGAAGVSWGDWSHFVVYTRQVNAFLPGSFVSTLAVLATIAEVASGLALLLGVMIRPALGGVALLFTIYGCAMTASLGAGSTFPYAVWLLAATALALVWCDASRLSIDRRRTRHVAAAA
jgi:uncharacterized membrane protein YphA (DoxX/SURF4 family)